MHLVLPSAWHRRETSKNSFKMMDERPWHNRGYELSLAIRRKHLAVKGRLLKRPSMFGNRHAIQDRFEPDLSRSSQPNEVEVPVTSHHPEVRGFKCTRMSHTKGRLAFPVLHCWMSAQSGRPNYFTLSVKLSFPGEASADP